MCDSDSDHSLEHLINRKAYFEKELDDMSVNLRHDIALTARKIKKKEMMKKEEEHKIEGRKIKDIHRKFADLALALSNLKGIVKYNLFWIDSTHEQYEGLHNDYVPKNFKVRDMNGERNLQFHPDEN